MDILLLLGCHGLGDKDGYVYCRGVANPVINLSYLGGKEKEKVIQFFDDACGLFDAPCNDYNKCINIINFLYKKFSIIEEEKLHKIQSFIRMHKTCGIYMMLIPGDEFDE